MSGHIDRKGRRLLTLRPAPVTDIPQIADPLSLLGGNKRVMGTIVGTRNDARAALDYCARVRLSHLTIAHADNLLQGLVKPHITQYPYSQLPEAVQKLKSGQVVGRCVVNFDE